MPCRRARASFLAGCHPAMLPCWLPPIVRAIASVLLTCLLARVQESTARHEGSPLGSSFVTLSDSSSGETTGETSEGLSDDAVATLSLERGLAAHRRYLALLFTLLFGVHLLVSIVLLIVFRSGPSNVSPRFLLLR